MPPPRAAGRGLVLVGYRGTGKSTVGRLLAAAMNRTFVDMDVEIEAHSGQTIAAIFAQSGEPGFRDWEERTLAQLLDRNPTAVVATGAGRSCAKRIAAGSASSAKSSGSPRTRMSSHAGSSRMTRPGRQARFDFGRSDPGDRTRLAGAHADL